MINLKLLNIHFFQKPVNELGQSYVTFVSLNLVQLREKIGDEVFVNSTFDVSRNITETHNSYVIFLPLIFQQNWYTEQVKMISAWLSERMEICLHAYQLACLTLIVKNVRNDFEMQGTDPEEILDTKTYNSILSRINVEEANAALK